VVLFGGCYWYSIRIYDGLIILDHFVTGKLRYSKYIQGNQRRSVTLNYLELDHIKDDYMADQVSSHPYLSHVKDNNIVFGNE
jgi:hypothetical protein